MFASLLHIPFNILRLASIVFANYNWIHTRISFCRSAHEIWQKPSKSVRRFSSATSFLEVRLSGIETFLISLLEPTTEIVNVCASYPFVMLLVPLLGFLAECHLFDHVQHSNIVQFIGPVAHLSPTYYNPQYCSHSLYFFSKYKIACICYISRCIVRFVPTGKDNNESSTMIFIPSLQLLYWQLLASLHYSIQKMHSAFVRSGILWSIR